MYIALSPDVWYNLKRQSQTKFFIYWHCSSVSQKDLCREYLSLYSMNIAYQVAALPSWLLPDLNFIANYSLSGFSRAKR